MSRNKRIKVYLSVVLILMMLFTYCFAFAEDEASPPAENETEQTNEAEENQSQNQQGEEQKATEFDIDKASEANFGSTNKVDKGVVKVDKNGKPELKSGSAIIYCKNTGEKVYAKSEKKKFAPYSLTKLMTAILVTQKLSLDAKVTISAEAAKLSNQEKGIQLKEGEILTVDQLLHAMLIMSDNGAAYALGEAVSGSMDEFIKLMNETSKNIGCKDTLFATPNGLIDDVSAEHTTASDFLEIAKVAFANKTISKVSGTKNYRIPKTEMSDVRFLKNSNKLLSGSKSGYVSGKLGYISENSTSITMVYKQNGMELIMVSLGVGKNTRYTICEKMVDYAKTKIKGIEVVPKGKILGKARVKHGVKTRVDVESASSAMAYLPAQGSKDLIKTEVVLKSDVEAPIKKGDVMGSYRIYVSDEQVNEIDLVSTESVGTGWIPSYIGISNKTTIIVLFVIFLIVSLLMLRTVNKAKTKARRRKLRKERIKQLAMEELMREHERNNRYNRYR